MIPRVEIKARELLQKGERLTPFSLAEKVYCHTATARMVLKKLHAQNVCRIVSWEPRRNGHIAVYGIGRKTDAIKPDPLTTQERVNRYLKDPEKRRIVVARKRAARNIAKLLKELKAMEVIK